MKVLYIWNTAGALSPVMKYLADNKHEVRVVIREGYDKFHKTDPLPFSIIAHSTKDLYLKSLKALLTFRPDIIHVNSRAEMLLFLRMFTRRPIILMYHGTDIRGKRESRYARFATLKIVSTKDLSEYGVYIGRPIDDSFSYQGGRIAGTALMCYYPHFPKDLRLRAMDWSNENDITLFIHSDSIPHEQMPAFLSRFEYYIDFKGCEDLSLTALEAIQCGCKVVHDNDADFERPVSPDRFLELYQDVLGG